MKEVVLLILCLISLSSNSGDAGFGTITLIEYTYGGKLLFRHSGTRIDPPDCVGTNFVTRWAIDATAEGRKAQLVDGLLVAYTTGKKISIRGKNDCSVWSDTETVQDFWMSS